VRTVVSCTPGAWYIRRILPYRTQDNGVEGVVITFVDITDPVNVRKAIQPRTKLIWVETPSNPLLKITDIAEVAAAAHEAGALCACDNTFATPVLQNPFRFGADLIVHASAKYLGGHCDAAGGLVIAHRDDNGFNWQRFALVWSAVIFVFFSVSGSKLPSYILPIFPALALAMTRITRRYRSAPPAAPSRHTTGDGVGAGAILAFPWTTEPAAPLHDRDSRVGPGAPG
jgi:hypothetical protein